MKKLVKTCAPVALILAALGWSGVAFATDYTCTPSHVGVMGNRIHVRCTAATMDGSSSIWYFAVPTSDAAYANRFLTTANTALVSGRNLVVRYTLGDTSGAAWGCLASDCRSIWGFLLL